LVRIILFTVCLLGAALARAEDILDRTGYFEISAQALNTAIVEFAKQARIEVSADSNLLRQYRAPSIKGQKTARDALETLLAESGLVYRVVRGAVLIAPASKTNEATGVRKRRADPVVAQLGPGATGRPAANSDAGQVTEEIVVTAQKRQELLEDVPISISVLRGEELDRSNVGVTDWLNRVPGVMATVNAQSGGTQLAMRGVTASSALFGGASPIAYYVDSVPFGLVKTAIVPDSNAYDLERIEVLRGPQGTLYGATALNGVVRVLTKDADLTEFDLKGRASFSTTEDGGNNYRGDMAINVPLVSGKLAVRAVAGYEDLSGWIDKPTKQDANDAQLTNGRIKIGLQPSESLNVGLSAWIARQRYGAPSRGNDFRQAPNPTIDEPEPAATDQNAYGLTVRYEAHGFSLSSMTGYLDYASASDLDLGSAFLLTELQARVLSQEVVLSSVRTDEWRWSVGAMYRDAKDRLYSDIPGLIPAPIDYSLESRSLAFFGEVTFILLDDRLELTAGLRHFHDDVRQTEHVAADGNPASPLVRSHSKFETNSPRIILTWYPRSRLTLYASYAEGFRSGFDQNPAVLRTIPDFPPVEADTLKNYELGAKGALLDGRVGYDIALYYIDWRDVMQQVAVPYSDAFIGTVVNGTSASGIGGDMGLSFRPTKGLALGLTFSVNDLTLDGVVISRGLVLFDKGDRLMLAPKYTVGVFVDYSFGLGHGGLLGRVAFSANHSDKVMHRMLPPEGLREFTGDSMTVARASFSIDSASHWSATLYVDNINNEQGTPVRSVNGTSGYDLRIRPRTSGLQVEYRFQ
jgi:iron complex outermembrane receptor protein